MPADLPSGRFRFRAQIATALLAAALPIIAHAQEHPDSTSARTISLLRGDLYSAQFEDRLTVFLVTPEGIVLADPLSRPASEWLLDEFERRFAGRPVKYVLHTHHHFDRSEGASVFQSTAESIGHRHFSRELTRAMHVVPPFLDGYYLTAAGALVRNQLPPHALTPLIDARDTNRDGTVTPEELYGGVTAPARDFGSRRRIQLGGHVVEIIHVGGSHAADMAVLYFPDQGVVFAVDPPPVSATPFQFGALAPHEAMDWLRRISALDFEVLVTGDGRRIARAELVELSTYLEGLQAIVTSAYASGMPLTELDGSARLEPISRSVHYQARRSQMAAMYDRARVLFGELSANALIRYTDADEGYCADHETCTGGGAVQGGAAAMRFGLGRRVRIAAELTWGGQTWRSRARPRYVEEYAFRATGVSALAGYGSPPQKVTYWILGGVSWIHGDTSGSSRLEGAVLPLGGSHPISARESRLGLTAGLDLIMPIGRDFSLVAPLRITRLIGPARPTWPFGTDVRIGIGLSVRVFDIVQSTTNRAR